MEYFVNIMQKCAFFYINYARMASFAYWGVWYFSADGEVFFATRLGSECVSN